MNFKLRGGVSLLNVFARLTFGPDSLPNSRSKVSLINFSAFCVDVLSAAAAMTTVGKSLAI